MFPGTPVFMTFGNDDAYRGDYDLERNGAFLHDMAPMCQAALGSSVDTAGFSNFAELGCYVAAVPNIGRRVLSVSNVFWSSSRYANENPPTGDKIITWLKDQLDTAAKAKEPVWLLMHIPPGGSCYVDRSHHARHTHNWQPSYQAAFEQLLASTDADIEIMFSGHTHMDDFRFITYPNHGHNKTLMTKIVPGVSPKFGQHSGYQVYTMSDSTISDWTTHYYDTGSWKTYSTVADYGSAKPDELLKAFRAMQTHPTTSGHYCHDYTVRRHPLSSSHVEDFLTEVLHMAPPPRIEYPSDAVSIEAAMELDPIAD